MTMQKIGKDGGITRYNALGRDVHGAIAVPLASMAHPDHGGKP
jgi:DNA-directed RNA polymerase